MGNSSAKPEVSAPTPIEVAAPAASTGNDDPAKKKPCPACSACKPTRAIRDACVFEKGEDNCADVIEAHKQCLRDHGMKI